MSEKPLPFVITDRRRFTSEGETRPDYVPEPEADKPAPAAVTEAAATPAEPQPAALATETAASPATEDESAMPPAPTDEQMEQSRVAYEATAERLDTAVRAANPGMEHPPAMSLDQIVQSVYMQAILQLGGGTEEGKQPQVDILGAKQSVDMLGILQEKTAGNLDQAESAMLSSALFELRLAFLEITQALARSAQQRAMQTPGAAPAMPGGPRPGPSIVR